MLPERNRIAADACPVEEWWEWDGHRIHIDRYANPNAQAKVILLHGVGGNGRVLSFVGAPLRRRGFAVVAPDLPPYGLSALRRGHRLAYGDWVRLVDDLIKAEQVREPLPVFLFGLSAGGMLAYQAACLNPDVAGVMATCLLDQRLQAVRDGSAANRLISRAGPLLLRLLGRLHGGIRLPMKAVANMRALINDPRLLTTLMRDKRSAGASVPIRFLTTMIEAQPGLEPEEFGRCPVLLIHPAEDRWVSVDLSRLFFDRLACPKRLVLLERCGHFPLESPGYEQMEAAVVTFMEEALRTKGETALI